MAAIKHEREHRYINGVQWFECKKCKAWRRKDKFCKNRECQFGITRECLQCRTERKAENKARKLEAKNGD